jgi:hypothetical protein
MKTIETEINNYKISLEIWQEDGETRSSCFVESPKGSSNSLALLSDLGQFDDSNERISDRILHRIEDWALENGY